MWVLRTKPWSSAKAESAHKHSAISLGLQLWHFLRVKYGGYAFTKCFPECENMMRAADLEMRLDNYTAILQSFGLILERPFSNSKSLGIKKREREKWSILCCNFESNLNRDIKHRVIFSVYDIRLHTLILRTGSRYLKGVKHLADSRHGQEWGNDYKNRWQHSLPLRWQRKSSCAGS